MIQILQVEVAMFDSMADDPILQPGDMINEGVVVHTISSPAPREYRILAGPCYKQTERVGPVWGPLQELTYTRGDKLMVLRGAPLPPPNRPVHSQV